MTFKNFHIHIFELQTTKHQDWLHKDVLFYVIEHQHTRIVFNVT